MTDLLLLTVPGLPLVLAATLLAPSLRTAAIALAPCGALPALAVALGPESALSAPWLLLGTELRADGTARAFLLFSGLLWFVSGLAARSYLAADERRTGFFAGFLLAMAGNLGLLVAADVFSFYTLFALMSFASYALVVHARGAEARFAARVYIAFVVLGELALFAGLGLAAHAANSTLLADMRAAGLPPEAIALIMAGLCVKLGIMPLHLWLPLAHAAAPVPASAVLSGAMIKAGLFGLIVLLPFGQSALPEAGNVLLLSGAVSIGLAAAIGVTQRDAKSVLAYSSIGQMGLAAVALGVAFEAPQAWPVILPALLFFAAHHALAKGALFLGVGALAGSSRRASRHAIMVVLTVLAAALAAAPFTAGALAKSGLKEGIASAGPTELALIVLTLSSAATTLLMARFLFLAYRRKGGGPSLATPWLGLSAAAVALPSAWPMLTAQASPRSGPVLDAAWPIAAALVLAIAAATICRLLGVGARSIPPGEILALFERRPARPERLSTARARPLKRRVKHNYSLPSLPRSWQAGATATVAALVTMAAFELVDQDHQTIQREPGEVGSPP